MKKEEGTECVCDSHYHSTMKHSNKRMNKPSNDMVMHHNVHNKWKRDNLMVLARLNATQNAFAGAKMVIAKSKMILSIKK